MRPMPVNQNSNRDAIRQYTLGAQPQPGTMYPGGSPGGVPTAPPTTPPTTGTQFAGGSPGGVPRMM
jgi:hypothetical protein